MYCMHTEVEKAVAIPYDLVGCDSKKTYSADSRKSYSDAYCVSVRVDQLSCSAALAAATAVAALLLRLLLLHQKLLALGAFPVLVSCFCNHGPKEGGSALATAAVSRRQQTRRFPSGEGHRIVVAQSCVCTFAAHLRGHGQ